MIEKDVIILFEKFANSELPMSDWNKYFNFSPNDALKLVNFQIDIIEDNNGDGFSE